MRLDDIRARLDRERTRKLKPVSIRLEPAVADRLARLALSARTTGSGLARVAIERMLDELDAQHGSTATDADPGVSVRDGRVRR